MASFATENRKNPEKTLWYSVLGRIDFLNPLAALLHLILLLVTGAVPKIISFSLCQTDIVQCFQKARIPPNKIDF